MFKGAFLTVLTAAALVIGCCVVPRLAQLTMCKPPVRSWYFPISTMAKHSRAPSLGFTPK